MSKNKDKSAQIGCFVIIIAVIGIVAYVQYFYTPEPDTFELISEKNMGFSRVLIFQANDPVEEQDAINHAKKLESGTSTSQTVIYFKKDADIPEELKENFSMDSYYFRNCMGIAQKPATDSLNWHSGSISEEKLLDLNNE